MDILKRLSEREFLITVASFVAAVAALLGHQVSSDVVLNILMIVAQVAGMIAVPIAFIWSRTKVKVAQHGATASTAVAQINAASVNKAASIGYTADAVSGTYTPIETDAENKARVAFAKASR